MKFVFFQCIRRPGKIKQSKSDEFFHDFDLFLAPRGNGDPSTVGFQLPDIFQTTSSENCAGFTFTDSAKTELCTKISEKSSEKRVREVTKHLASVFKQKRMQVLYSVARTKAALRSKEFFRLYTSPSDSILSRKSKTASNLRTRFQKPKKSLSYQMEYEKLRGLRESEEELARVQNYIDRMIAKNIKKFEDEKKQELKTKNVEYRYPTLQELVKEAKIKVQSSSSKPNFISVE